METVNRLSPESPFGFAKLGPPAGDLDQRSTESERWGLTSKASGEAPGLGSSAPGGQSISSWGCSGSVGSKQSRHLASYALLAPSTTSSSDRTMR